jgi:hypothetical protein
VWFCTFKHPQLSLAEHWVQTNGINLNCQEDGLRVFIQIAWLQVMNLQETACQLLHEAQHGKVFSGLRVRRHK